MRKSLLETKKHIYRTTAVLFLFQLFGALGAGFLFVVGNILGIEILKPGHAFSEVLWHLFFWATDFFFIALVMILSYLIAGLPALAPALTLGVYFAHFAGQYAGSGFDTPLYGAFFATPRSDAGGVNIGYMGYLIMALLLGYLIKNLFALWDKIKLTAGPKLNRPIAAVQKKIKPLQDLSLDGVTLLEGIDLIVLFLILPIVSAIITYCAVQYLIAVPFNALGEALEPVIVNLYQSSNTLGGILSGALVGFDLIGPLSKAAFRAAGTLASTGNAVPMTVYALCFAVMGWVPMAGYLLSKVTKKGGKMDTDDMNIAVSGPINAFFDNMKLTVNFSMTFAMRDPVRVILSFITSGALTGVLAGAFALGNKNYITNEFIEKFLSNEIYVSFLQPMRSITATSKGLLLPVCGAVGALAGAVVMIFLKELAYKKQLKNSSVFEPDGDIVLEVRGISQRFNKKHPTEKTCDGEIQESDATDHLKTKA
ncbi:MAG: hypothetical protein LBS36_07050 [Oscillospiraceae bacterium]|jgi:fructose-specific phosphotransferase system IIC component|nr:hypothetical protein [Oscillospiraceae bacterium]